MTTQKQPDAWARALRQERLARGIDLASFALLLGYAPYASNVSHIEAGRRVVGLRGRSNIELRLGKRLLPEGET